MSVLNNNTILSGFEALGQRLKLGRDVEILVVGGAAGVLTELLPDSWTTADVDAFHCHLPQDREAVMAAAEEACRELSLPADWLNDWGGKYAWTLPDNWKSRRVLVGQFGRLRVYAVSRLDLIAMKFIAHRTEDLEHLALLCVTEDDKKFVRSYLDWLEGQYPAGMFPEEAGKTAMARQYLENWVGAL